MNNESQWPRRAAYIAGIDLPNRKAHAVQMMKNGAAWAGAVAAFEFLTPVDPRHWRQLDAASLATFYGLERPLPLRAYPLRWPDHNGQPRPLPLRLFHHLAARRCQRRQVELVHTRTFSAPLHTLPLGIPTLVESHSAPEDTTFAAEKRRLYPLLASHPLLLGLVTQSRHNRDALLARGVPAEKVLMIPNGVDLSRFAHPLDRQAARAALGLQRWQPLAVYAGHLYAGRGVEEIVAAAARLPQVDFLLVGGFPGDVARWRREVARQGLANVILTGFVENARLPLLLWAADVLLMPYSASCPTAAEMCPLKMLEYMAAGRPLVATDLPALRPILRHGENAWLVPPDHAESLAGAVAQLLREPVLASALAAQARQDVAALGLERRVAAILSFARERLRHARHAAPPRG